MQVAIALTGTGLRELLHPSPAGDAQHRAETTVTWAAPRVAGLCGMGAKEREQALAAGLVPARQC